MQGELTLRLSSSWMYIAYISLLFDLFSPLCWWFDKKWEKNFESLFESLYMHVYFLFNAYMFCLCKKGRSIWKVSLCLFPHLWIYMLFVLCTSWNIFMFIVMHELRGSIYEAYFNPCIYNSISFVIIKKGEIVGPKGLSL